MYLSIGQFSPAGGPGQAVKMKGRLFDAPACVSLPLDSPKQFNVAVTRATLLLIIVGDTGLLQTMAMSWGPLIKQLG